MHACPALSSSASAIESTPVTDSTSGNDEKLEKLTRQIEELREVIKNGSITESQCSYGSKAQSGSHKSALKSGGDDDDSDNF